MQRIRKGDQVAVLAGRDKGKRGEVLRVIPADSRVVVQGVNVVKRHRKPTQMSAGGIEEIEAPIHVSNVAHIDPDSDKPTRVGFKTLEDGTKVRFSKRSGDVLDR
ncbi:MAG: 50S ribosomal protein L24 [Rhodospirillales bacterium]|jgi:large subunit ribosomal protein L24